MELLKAIKDKAPEYDACHKEMIAKFTVGQGGRVGTTTEATGYVQGKYFQFMYEIYIYASLIGMKRDYRLPIPQGAKKEKFIDINAWKPHDLAEYVIMGVFAKSDIDFFELESKTDKEVEAEILKFRNLLEDYANGGFDIIRAKLESDPAFFEHNDNCFIDLLGE